MGWDITSFCIATLMVGASIPAIAVSGVDMVIGRLPFSERGKYTSFVYSGKTHRLFVGPMAGGLLMQCGGQLAVFGQPAVAAIILIILANRLSSH